MTDKYDGQKLIQAFFAALQKRELSQCELVLAQLHLFADERSAYIPWCAYLEGVLINERDFDWSASEHIFTDLLLQPDLERPLRGKVLMALGRTFEYQGLWVEAIRSYEETIPIFATLEQPIEQVKAWKNIAIACQKGFTRGDLDAKALEQGIKHCQRALNTLQALAKPTEDELWLEATTWNALGLIYRHLQQWDEAISCYQRRLKIGKKLNNRFGIGIAYGNLGEVYQLQGPEYWPNALAAYQEAHTIFREFDNSYEAIEVLANLASLHHDMGDVVAALEYYMQAIEMIETLRQGVTSTSGRTGYFSTVSDTYANVVLLYLEKGDHIQAFNMAERARSRALLDIVVTGSSALTQTEVAKPMTLAEVQKSLPIDTLLLAYFTTGLVETPDSQPASVQAPQRHRFPLPKTFIFAVTHDAFQVYDTGLSPNDLRPSQLESVVERHFLQPQIRRTLYKTLIAPVEESIKNKRRLYIVPHGPLHYIPFQALIAADGETVLREDGPQVIYAPGVTILFRYERSKAGRPSQSCLALGYNDTGERQLRFAEEEARSVAKLTTGTAYVGTATKKAVLFNQADDFRFLHISCHGEFDPEIPMSSALHLAPDEKLTAADILNHLTLRCDLVTLSACESGLSQVRRGDEIMGFIRAFMVAGAPLLISTLWRVDERSTLILMVRFYQEVQRGLDFAEALKRAQLYLKSLSREEAQTVLAHFWAEELLDQWTRSSKGSGEQKVLPGNDDAERIFADPYYWAPFILVGAFESGVSQSGKAAKRLG